MIENLKHRILIIVGILLLAGITLIPNFVDTEGKSWLPEKKLNYGLDIQGGLHLVLGVDVEGALNERMNRAVLGLKEEMSQKGIIVNDIKYAKGKNPTLTITGDSDTLAKAKSHLNEFYPDSYSVYSSGSGDLEIKYYDTYKTTLEKQTVDQSIEVIRNRLDVTGTKEPVIAAQGTSRILVQLPGAEDAQKQKELINRAAMLEFMILSEDEAGAKLPEWIAEVEKAGDYALGKDGMSVAAYAKRINEDLKEKLPAETEVVFEQLPNVKTLLEGKTPRLVKNDRVFTGDKIASARVGGDEYGNPVVNFSIAPLGRKEFGELTGTSIKKPMGIILDKVMKSAPTIQAKLTSGGQISVGQSGNYNESFEEAQFIATTIRAGSLPAQLTQLEERTVGPSLGKDSIDKGKFAGMIAGLLVLVFILIWYMGLGVVAGVALGVNIGLILAILTSFESTLTLPGIAGIVLTVGMAVDANVIIFERIREELAKGAGPRAAVKDGFGHALSAIVDANLTTIGVCVVLMIFGTGPIKGFAVTLIAGIVTSMFTAIFLTRTIVDYLVQKKGWTKLFPRMNSGKNKLKEKYS